MAAANSPTTSLFIAPQSVSESGSPSALKRAASGASNSGKPKGYFVAALGLG